MDFEKINNDISEIQEIISDCIYPLEERNKAFETIHKLSESIKDSSIKYKKETMKTKNILKKNYYISLLIAVVILFVVGRSIFNILIKMAILFILLFILNKLLRNKKR